MQYFQFRPGFNGTQNYTNRSIFNEIFGDSSEAIDYLLVSGITRESQVIGCHCNNFLQIIQDDARYFFFIEPECNNVFIFKNRF
jgi:site-specific DNA-adenine methylase